MYVKRLRFENFRNLINGEIFPYEGINVIYGENAQGKTNLLESIWLFTGGHSFRGAKDSELMKFSKDSGEIEKFAKLELDFWSEGREQNAVLNIVNGRRNSVINGVKKKTGSALIGKVCAVIFSPEHLLLVKEGPARRRSFVDGAICQIKPAYAKILGIYNRSLMQRNALLKDISRHPELFDTLEVWNERLAKLGAQVMLERQSYLNKLMDKIPEIYLGISKNREGMKIEYMPSVKIKNDFTERDVEESFFRELCKSEKSDVRSGFTSVGPHRDDVEIFVDNISARMYASQGQQRSAVLSMKLAEAEVLAEETSEAPIILLDDVMSELDKSRQDYLLNHLDNKQVFITCCDPEAVNPLRTGMKVYIEKGNVNIDIVSD